MDIGKSVSNEVSGWNGFGGSEMDLADRSDQ